MLETSSPYGRMFDYENYARNPVFRSFGLPTPEFRGSFEKRYAAMMALFDREKGSDPRSGRELTNRFARRLNRFFKSGELAQAVYEKLRARGLTLPTDGNDRSRALTSCGTSFRNPPN